ncbi:MAG: T9SS type A sorting domain-containing protein [Bacteroides sp.]
MKNIIFALFVMCTIPIFPSTYPEGNNSYCNRLADAGNYLWIASNKGLVRYEKTTGKCEFYTEKVGYDNTAIFTCVYTDNEDNLWFGTRKDYLCKYNESSLSKYQAHNFSPFCWFSIAFDTNNDPWSASSVIFYDYKKNDNKYFNFGSINLTGGTSWIMDMKFDSKGNLWMVTDTSLYNYHYLVCKKKEASNIDFILSGLKVATSLAIDNQDNIWFVCDDGIHYYNPRIQTDIHYTSENTSNIPNTIYTACKIDNKGNIWFVGSTSLLKYDGNKFTSYDCPGFNEARSILCDNNVIWIYTNNDDVFRFEEGKFTHVHIENGTSNINFTKNDTDKLSVTCNKNGIIKINSNREITRVNIYTISGVLVLSYLSNGEKEIVLENSKLPKGIYLFKTSYSDSKITSKVFIE